MDRERETRHSETGGRMSAANSMARGSTCSEAEALFSACRPPMGHLLSASGKGQWILSFAGVFRSLCILYFCIFRRKFSIFEILNVD